MCPSRRLTQTGLSGVTASIQSFRGSSTGVNCWWSQSPFRIQRPGPSSRALAAMRAVKSWRLLASRSWMLFRANPPARKWVWLSMNPGRTSDPPRSTSFVPTPASGLSSDVLPAMKILPSRTATASAQGCPASPVQTLPLTKTRSTMFPSGAFLQPCDEPKARIRASTRMIFFTFVSLKPYIKESPSESKPCSVGLHLVRAESALPRPLPGTDARHVRPAALRATRTRSGGRNSRRGEQTDRLGRALQSGNICVRRQFLKKLVRIVLRARRQRTILQVAPKTPLGAESGYAASRRRRTGARRRRGCLPSRPRPTRW